MNSILINSQKRDFFCFKMESLILIMILFFTGSSLQVMAQGLTCATAEPLYVNFNAATRTANGPSLGNGAVNSCFLNSHATHANWYKYTPSFNGHILVSSCWQGVDTRLSIFTGTCGDLICVGSGDDNCAMYSGSPNWAAKLENFTVVAGTTYYIQWDNRWSSSGFDWILWEYPDTAPNNHFCDATLLNCGSSIIGTTYGADESGEGSSCGFGSNNDVYYKINALAGVQYTVTLSGQFFEGIMSIHYISSQVGECDYNTQLTEISCADNGGYEEAETITFSRVQDQVIFVRVTESYYTGQSGFYVGLSCAPPANDECANATNLILNGSPKSGNNNTATASTNIPINCGNGGDKSTDADVWYKFVAPESGKIIIETFAPLAWIGGGINDSQLQVLDACGGEVLFCNDDRGHIFLPILMAKITIPCDAYTPFETYYIQVDGKNGARGRFRISVVTTPCPIPANDDCASATSLAVNEIDACPSNQTYGTTSGATPSDPAACESTSQDVYYTFSSGNNSEVIINLTAVSATDLVLSAFEASCSSTALFCSLNNPTYSMSVTPFTTYYVRVHSWLPGQAGSFNICIEKVAPEIALLNGSIVWNTSCGERAATVKLYTPGTATLVASYDVTIQSDGSFNVPELEVGTFDVIVKVDGYLAKGITGVEIAGGDNSLAIGAIINGNINKDGVVNINDFSLFAPAFSSIVGNTNYNSLADFNCNGVVNITDFSIFVTGFNKLGDTAPLTPILSTK